MKKIIEEDWEGRTTGAITVCDLCGEEIPRDHSAFGKIPVVGGGELRVWYAQEPKNNTDPGQLGDICTRCLVLHLFTNLQRVSTKRGK